MPSMPYTTRLDRSGRLVLPAALRAELELREGDEVVFLASTAAGEVRLVPRRAAVRQSQSIVREHVPTGSHVVDDLLRRRRGDAAAESPPTVSQRRR